MARYWVGNGGTWNDTAHWSATSGGAGGETVPGISDDVTFDAASFSVTSAISDGGSNLVDIKSWDSSAIDQTLTWSLSGNVTIRGNFTLKSGQTINGGTLKTLTLSGSSSVFTPNGVTINYAYFKFTGTYTLAGNLIMPSITDDTLLVRGGTITTNNYSITTDNLTVDTSGSLILGSSTITLGGDFSWSSAGTLSLGSSTMTVGGAFSVSGGTVTAGTSTISITHGGETIAGGGKTYYTVNLSGNNQTVTGSNTFNTLNLNTAGLATGTKFTAGTTQTMTNFATNGSAGSLAKMLSTSAGTHYHFSTPSGEINENYMSITDCYAIEAGVWYAGDNSTDGGGNTNWVFGTPIPRKNTAVGSEAGYSNDEGYGNLFLGYRAGYSELGDNKLYISNSQRTDPLILGDFVAETLTINGALTSDSMTITGAMTAANFISTVATGTSPYAATSTTLNTNLNADLIDSVHVASLTDARLLRYESTGTQIENATVTETSGALGGITTISMSGQLTNTLAISTSPFAVTSTTVNTNLNADLLDGVHESVFSLIDGTRNFTGVVGGIFPTASNHLVTKEYVDQAISFISEYFFNNTASSIGGIYYKMLESLTGEAESTFTSGSLGAGDNQALFNFATDANIPGAVTLQSGVYPAHIHAEKTAGTKPAKIYFIIYTRATDTTETPRATSETSDYITTKTAIDLHATVTSDVTIAATDRIIIKWFANVEATGSDATIALYAEGVDASSLAVPTSVEVLNSVFVRKDGTQALTADWDAGSFEIRAQTFESDVATSTAPLIVASTTVVTNLNADLLDGQHGSYFLDSANFTGTNWTDLTDGGATTLHSHAGGGYTTLSQFVDETAWRSFYSNGSGDVTALAFGDAGKVLTSGGASAAPTWETPSSGTHEILSATHTDSTAAAVARGDIITGQGATPKWVKLVKGGAGAFLTGDGTDVAWSTGFLAITATKTLTVTGDSTISGGTHSGNNTGDQAVATDVIWDAKGDLAGGTGANTASKLTVGSNGQHLEAQSGEATGLKWVNPTTFLTVQVFS